MKTRTLTLLSLTIVVLLIVGTFAFIRIGASELLIADQVKIEPKPFDIYNGDDVIVQVKLFIGKTPVVDQIDPDTVLLEGAVIPTDTWTTRAPPNFYAQFDGSWVADHLWAKIIHEGITRPHPWTPIKIPLTITGELYDGTPWEGVGEIKVYIHNPGPPPPPPP